MDVHRRPGSWQNHGGRPPQGAGHLCADLWLRGAGEDTPNISAVSDPLMHDLMLHPLLLRVLGFIYEGLESGVWGGAFTVIFFHGECNGGLNLGSMKGQKFYKTESG